METKLTPLFGGALQALIPASYMDASSIRTIPDHQEVFLDTLSEQSLIIELIDMDSHIEKDQMFIYHVAQIMQENEAQEVKMIHKSELKTLHDEKHSNYVLFLTQTGVVSFKGTKFHTTTTTSNTSSLPHSVVLYFGVLRIPKVQTDILVSMYFPNVQTFHSNQFNWFETIFSSLFILDWTLFANPSEE